MSLLPCESPSVDTMLPPILYAEDTALERASLTEILELSGHHVDAVKNGEEAWRRFSLDPGRWGIVLTDGHMDPCTGYELAARIRSAGYDTPILLYTGSPVPDDAREYFTEIIRKPNTEDLYKALAKHYTRLRLAS